MTTSTDTSANPAETAGICASTGAAPLTISRAEYDQLRAHDYAGPGTPLHPNNAGHWMTGYESGAGTVLYTGVVVVDDRDAAILAERVAELNAVKGPRVGDHVRFSDGVERRISHHWGDCIQTSDGGSWYLGHGYTSFSGGLRLPVPVETLSDSGETRAGRCWFFHHDYHVAGGAVEVRIPFRVFDCSAPATD